MIITPNWARFGISLVEKAKSMNGVYWASLKKARSCFKAKITSNQFLQNWLRQTKGKCECKQRMFITISVEVGIVH